MAEPNSVMNPISAAAPGNRAQLAEQQLCNAVAAAHVKIIFFVDIHFTDDPEHARGFAHGGIHPGYIVYVHVHLVRRPRARLNTRRVLVTVVITTLSALIILLLPFSFSRPITLSARSPMRILSVQLFRDGRQIVFSHVAAQHAPRSAPDSMSAILQNCGPSLVRSWTGRG